MKNQNAQFKKLIKSHMKWQKEDLAGKARGMFFSGGKREGLRETFIAQGEGD